MPDVTPVYGWPIPVLTDDPNIPADVSALGLAIESTAAATSAGLAAHAARVFRSGADGAATIANATDVTLNFPSTKFDTDGFQTSPSRLTIPTGLGGYYILGGGVQMEASGSGTHRRVWIEANGSGNPIVATSGGVSATQNARGSISTVTNLGDGDYLQLHAYQDSGGPLSGVIDNPAFPSFWLVRIPFL
jgi:hypothetical protein